MQDRETDTYWSIMNDMAVSGKLSGKRLEKIPSGIKTQWKDWKEKYPQSLVLSVNGKEDAPVGYTNYYNSAAGYRGIQAKDRRLPDKEPVFTFEYDGRKFAIPTQSTEGGTVIKFDDGHIFLFRPVNAALFYSTQAFIISGDRFVNKNGLWKTEKNRCDFDREFRNFIGSGPSCPQRLTGFDTFWYIWSLINPDTKLLH